MKNVAKIENHNLDSQIEDNLLSPAQLEDELDLLKDDLVFLTPANTGAILTPANTGASIKEPHNKINEISADALTSLEYSDRLILEERELLRQEQEQMSVMIGKMRNLLKR